jgi:hypothetical protein
MPLGDRLHRRHRGPDRRLVRFGGEFTSEELAAGEVELELPEPSREPPDDEQAEPWNTSFTDPRFAARERAYREFLEQWDREHR